MRKFRLLTIFVIIFMIITILFFGYFSNFYHAEEEVNDYLVSNSGVKVYNYDNYYLFDGKGSEIAFVFYPGAKVEEKAYAKILFELSKNEIDCFLIKMPFRFALFKTNAIENISNINNYSKIYIGGHSLGGIAASEYVKNNYQRINGLVLLGSYSNSKLPDGLSVLSVYGSNDNILNREYYERSKNNLPKFYNEEIINGGNHAYYANYGDQEDDGTALISKEKQQNATINAIYNFITESNYNLKIAK